MKLSLKSRREYSGVKNKWKQLSPMTDMIHRHNYGKPGMTVSKGKMTHIYTYTCIYIWTSFSVSRISLGNFRIRLFTLLLSAIEDTVRK